MPLAMPHPQGCPQGRPGGLRLQPAVLTACAAALAACGGDGSPSAPPSPPAAVLSIAVLGVPERGADAWLVALSGSDTVRAGVQWSVSDTSVARVGVRANGDGVLTGRVAGRTVTVTARVGRDGGSRTVTIGQPPQVVFAFRPADTGNLDLYRVALDGTGLTNLTPDSPLDDFAPAVAGTQLVFASLRAGGSSRLFQMPLAGGTVLPLGNSPLSRTAPTVAGARVAFVSAVTGGDRVWMGDGVVTDALLDTTVNEDAVLEGDPALSPDGSRIAWWSTERGRPEVVVRSTAGGAKTRLELGNAAFAPAWRPDGLRLVLASNRDTTASGPVSLYQVDPATGTFTRLTARAGSDSDPDYLADGRVVHVAFTSAARGELRWVHPGVPGLGGTVPLPAGMPSKPRRLP